MSSNLKVNTILPSVGTAIGIGTAGDTITSIGSITVTNGRIGIGTAAPLQRLHIRGEGQGDHLLYLQAGDTICDIIQSDNGGSTRLRSANGSFYVWTGGDGNSSTGANGSPAIHVNTSLETKFYNTIKVVDKIEHDTDSDTSLRFPAEDTFSIETGGSERVRVTGIGSVGIGTTNPSALLHVEKNGTSQILAKFESNLGTNNNRFVSLTSPTSDNTNLPFTFLTGNSFEFKCDNHIGLHIDFDGKVGIDTGIPRLRSDIGGVSATGIGGLNNPILYAGLSQANSNGWSGVVLCAGSNGNTPTIASAKNTSGTGLPLLFQTNATTRMTITGDGTVTKPQQPYVKISGITNTGGSGNSNNGTATTYGDISYSAGKVTAQVEGNYLITYATISDSGTGRVDARIRVNGNVIAQFLTADNGTGYRQKSGSIVWHLNVNDYVQWENQDWWNASDNSSAWRTASVYMLG